ncbi:MAG: hypothetical protein BroJett029_01830 [Alphaproteobacteria bacterium]|nr:MAG: hypothetical protein BroJett029_01830 [Alphaproteobacteria bacterium]
MQPTEQWVQTDFAILSPDAAVCASALRTVVAPMSGMAAKPPATIPERRKKVRRSIAPPLAPAKDLAR